MNRIHKAVNYERRNDAVTQGAIDDNYKNVWFDKDVPFDKDPFVWKTDMTPEEQETFCEALSGLTLLDTKQGGKGMPLLVLHEEDDQVGALFTWFSAMEHIHAKSYSKVFMNLISREKTNYYLEEWVQKQPQLQYKAEKVVSVYELLKNWNATEEDKWKVKAVSTGLESGLFYSGFFFPLLLAGGWGGKDDKARMVNTNDIINLIIRDESLHGQYVGWSAHQHFQKFSPEKQAELIAWFTDFMMDLYENEVKYTEAVYTRVGLVDEVLKFVRFNFNQVFDNLNLDPIFEEEQVNPIVLAGLSTETKTHDYFSRTGNYASANVTPITDATFDFTRP